MTRHMSGYGADLAHVHAAAFTGMARDAARELLVRLPSAARVVELGCGDGTTAGLLAGAGHEVHGFDVSRAFVEMARDQEPRATFEVGSFVDAQLIPGCDAIVAVGEVLAYGLDERVDHSSLDAVLPRFWRALREGGVLLFDLPGPRRADASDQRTWTEGDGWVVLVETVADPKAITRRIVTFRDRGDGAFARGEERHRLHLHRPSDVLASLRRAGFTAETLPSGYGGGSLPDGLTAYIATKPSASRDPGPGGPGSP